MQTIVMINDCWFQEAVFGSFEKAQECVLNELNENNLANEFDIVEGDSIEFYTLNKTLVVKQGEYTLQELNLPTPKVKKEGRS